MNIKKTIIITFATMTLLLGFSKADNTYADQVEFEDSIVRAAETGLLSMVHIHSGIGSGGTGFYITPNTILTNEHVIRDAKEEDVQIELQNGKLCKVTYGQKDANVDLAILRTDCSGTELNLSNQKLRLAQSVVVVGNPQLFDKTVTRGGVSSLNRYGIYFQIDAKANYGSSGSPVLNSSGELIGVISKKAKEVDYVVMAIKADEVQKFLWRSGVQDKTIESNDEG